MDKCHLTLRKIIITGLHSIMDIILASTSIYRQSLLSDLKLPFKAVSPDFDETPMENESPLALVKRLAIGKSNSVASRFDQHLIIGSDQVACFDNKILGKPHTFDNAYRQLSLFSGNEVTFLTSVAVLNSCTSTVFSEVVPLTVQFRALKPAEIERYLEIEEPFDCAGSFKSEGLGSCLFNSISGTDPTSLIGLPIITLSKLLRNHDYNILEQI